MSLNRRAALAGLAACLLGLPAAAKRVPDNGLNLEQVIALNTRARGGARALDGIDHMHSSLLLKEHGMQMQGGYIASKNGFVRVDIFVKGKRVYSEGVDAKGGWKWGGDEAAPSQESEQGTRNLLEGIELNLYGLNRYRERGHQLTLIDEETMDGQPYYVVEARLKNGSVKNFYINSKTGLIERARSERVFHPDLDPKKSWIETRFYDYRPFNGIRVSTRGEEYDLIKKVVIQETWNTGESFNQKYDPGVLSRDFRPVGSLADLGIPVNRRTSE